MAIPKSSVLEFVGKVCDTRYNEVQDELNNFYAQHFDPTFNTVIKSLVEDIPFYAERMLKVLESERKNIEALGGMGEQSMNQLIAKVSNHGLYLFSTIRDNARHTIIYTIENPHRGAFDYGNDEINKLVARLQKDAKLRELVKRQGNINDLRKELVSNIHACKSGKQAFDTMVRLGVNMDDYKEPLSNLPAVVALSVDVCLLNGTC